MVLRDKVLQSGRGSQDLDSVERLRCEGEKNPESTRGDDREGGLRGIQWEPGLVDQADWTSDQNN
jgi:hypothetical protein